MIFAKVSYELNPTKKEVKVKNEERFIKKSNGRWGSNFVTQ